MQVVYATEPLPRNVRSSIFLAEPTPRSADVESGRPAALALLAERGYDGAVFVPARVDADAWFTTNVEFGDWARSGKCVLGAPPDAPKPALA